MYDPIEFFDEMNILQTDKNRRTETANRFFDKLVDFFKMQFMEILSGIFLYERTSQDYETELIDLYVAMLPDSTDADGINKAKRFAHYIQNTTEKTVQGAEGNENFKTGRMFGLKIKEQDVPDSVTTVLSKDRAMEIALNETNWIYNNENHKELVKKGQLTHTWLSKQDERVRDSHVRADGQTVPIDEPFTVNGYKMMFPSDDSLGAPASETLNCRCVEI